MSHDALSNKIKHKKRRRIKHWFDGKVSLLGVAWQVQKH
jgi:hypothetical protein